jgi:hypothetical protein
MHLQQRYKICKVLQGICIFMLFFQITVTTDDFTKLHSLVGRRYLPESLKGFVPESEGWEQNLEDGIKNGQNGIQLVQELLSAVEQHSNNSNDNDKK